jgi:hypothetical protein
VSPWFARSGEEVLVLLVSQIDYNLIADIVRLKEVVRESIDAVMEDRLTAGHLASDVYTLLDLLDKLEVTWRGAPPMEEVEPARAPQVEQPAQETSPAAAPQPEQPAQETPPAEVPQPEQTSPEGQQSA